MARIRLTTRVDAPRERVFDLARSVPFHVDSMRETDERVVDGVASGLLDAGDRLTFRGRHLGLTWDLSATVVALDRPRSFRDEMTAGPFAWLAHDHRFRDEGETVVVDEVDFGAPLRPLGRLADPVVAFHLRRTLARRNRRLKRAAEGDRWRDYLA
ncbi:MAG: SRPBCC family protein [Haloarculaceae archaeon]